MKNEQLKIDIVGRTTSFAIRIIKVANSLPKTPAGYAIASQIVRSGTSVGANLREAQSAASKKDFIHSVNISLKEARETAYWLELICNSSLLSTKSLEAIEQENEELIKILFAIIRKTKYNSSLLIDNS